MPVLYSAVSIDETDLGPDPIDYMKSFQERATECISNAYNMEHFLHESCSTGVLTTSLAEDVVSLLDTQRSTLLDYIADSGLQGSRHGEKMLADGLNFAFKVLQQMQRRCRLLFLTTLQDTCAAANDFMRLSDRMETFIKKLVHNHTFLRKSEKEGGHFGLLDAGSACCRQLSQDSVFATERTHVFIMREIQRTSIASDLFSSRWEDEWTSNEVVRRLMTIVDYHLRIIKRYLGNEFLYNKAMIVSAKSLVCFYVRCLIEKADSVTRRRRNKERLSERRGKKAFENSSRALLRMRDDITLMRNFYREQAGENQALTRMIIDEMRILELIHECLEATDSESFEVFLVVLHKTTGADALVTRHFAADLWLLVSPDLKKSHFDATLESLQPDLQMVSLRMEEREPRSKSDVSFVRLDEMLKALYEDRIAQGVLPLCWACLPKVEDEGNEVVSKRIRSFTRNVAERKWKKG